MEAWTLDGSRGSEGILLYRRVMEDTTDGKRGHLSISVRNRADHGRGTVIIFVTVVSGETYR